MSGTNKIIPVILCGGSGTRLWPISHKEFPKQYHDLIGETSLLQQTLKRATECTNADAGDIIIVTSEDLTQKTSDQINSFDPRALRHVISESCTRNTAPAIANAVLYAQNNFGDNAILWIMPSDHYIQDTQELECLINQAVPAADHGYIITLGITPDRPETGYGYIKAGDKINGDDNAYHVKNFTEKPDYHTAQKLIEDKTYSWNSGMFIATVQTFINNFEKFSPGIFLSLKKEITLNTYKALPSISFDKAVMEKTDKAAVIPCNIGWSDIGSWESLWRLITSMKTGNKHPVEMQSWGISQTLLHHKDHTIKEITIKSGQKIDLQNNKNQSKFWTVVKGEACITTGNELKVLGLKDSILIPAKTDHSIENRASEDLIIIEALEIQAIKNNL